MYDIVDNKQDLHLLDDAEPNLISHGVKREEYIHPDIEVVELSQKGIMVRVSKLDVEALAKHFGIIPVIGSDTSKPTELFAGTNKALDSLTALT